VVSRRGYSGTRLVDIATEADIQAPAIYYHYDSREELIEEVMFQGATAMRTHLLERLQQLADATPTERIAAAVDAHLRLELEISDYSTAIIRNANQLPEQVSERALTVVSEYNAIWRRLIDDLAAAGGLAADVDPSVARMLVLGALNWAVEWYRPDSGDLNTVIATAQTMILRALGANPNDR